MNQNQVVRICLCTNETYARYCAVTINSVICNRNLERMYQFYVLARISDLTTDSIERFNQLQERYDNVTITVMDVSDRVHMFQAKMRAYYTQEINYRFLLFTDLFQNYERMIYLDCDIICIADIGELYDMDLAGNAAGAVLEYGFYEKQLMQIAMFYKGIPYSYENYIQDIVGAKMGTSYFNSGVMVYDLEQCRKIISINQVVELLVEKEYIFPDQDCLNHILNGRMMILSSDWNYQALMAGVEQDKRKEIRKLYRKIFCDTPKILHFTSGNKPWTDSSIPWYKQYEQYMIE